LPPLTTEVTTLQAERPGAVGMVRGLAAKVATAEWLPWALAPLMILGYWVFEAWLHSHVFGQKALLVSLFSPDPHELWMRVGVAVMLLVVATLWFGAVRERNSRIRAMEHYQDRLREMSAWMSVDDGEERLGLSERLHEQVAQTLSAARMYLSGVETADSASHDALATAQGILDAAIAECREVAHELSPPVLDAYGLLSALEETARRVQNRAAARVVVAVGDDVPLNRTVLLTSFRVLSGVIESAAADPRTSAVRVSSRAGSSGLMVAVEWDSSYDDDLFGACELMFQVGGGLERRVTERGTRVVVTAPIAA